MSLSLQALPTAADALFSGQAQVTGARFSIGRASDNDWVISDPKRTVSKRHCTIERTADGYRILDNSTNGTSVNGRPVDRNGGHVLRDGDELAVGPYRFRILLSASDLGRDTGSETQPKITAILHDVAPAGVTATSALPGFQDHVQSDAPAARPRAARMNEIGWDGPPVHEPEVVKPADVLQPTNREFVNRSEQMPTQSLRIDLPRPKQIIPDDWYLDPADKPAASPAVDAQAPAPPEPQQAALNGVDRSAVIPVENIDVGASFEPPRHQSPPAAPAEAQLPHLSPPAHPPSEPGTAAEPLLQALYDGAGVPPPAQPPQDLVRFFHNLGRALSIAATGLHGLQQAKTRSAALLEIGETGQAGTPWIFSLSGQDQSQLVAALLALMDEVEPREINQMQTDFQDGTQFVAQLAEAVMGLLERLQRGVSIGALEQQAGAGGARLLPALRKAALWDALVQHSPLFSDKDGRVANIQLIELLHSELTKKPS